MTEYLDCPECETPTIPASGRLPGACRGAGFATWCEDDEADCPGCGARVGARFTGNGEGDEDFIEAVLLPSGGPDE